MTTPDGPPRGHPGAGRRQVTSPRGGDRCGTSRSRKDNVPHSDRTVVFVFGLNSCYLQREFNLVVDAYQGAAPGTQVSLAA